MERSSRNGTSASDAVKPAQSSGLAVSLAPNPFNPAGGVVSAALATPLASAAAPAVAPAESVPVTPVERLLKELDAMGVSTAGLQLSESRMIVNYPGGSYVNHLITADFGNGVTEQYDVGLMLKSPWLTAFEIGRLRKTVG
jgi:hypothetical protein